MEIVKRWAFVPLLVLVLVVLGGSIASKTGHSLTTGNIAGLIAAIPLAVVIAHRRRVRGM